jgi:cytidyltransferase-like protein
MALKKLREHFNETNINAFHKLLGNRVMVVEKVSAPSFYLRRMDNTFEFYKSSNSEPLTLVDRTMMSLYEVAIKHIQSLDPSSKDKLPSDFKFGFDYLPQVEVSEYSYDEVPHNNLILTHVQQLNESGKVKKTIIDPMIINKWAKVLDVQAQNVIFDGELTLEQKTKLIKLLEMNDKEFSDNFDYLIETDNETSFTKEIYRIFDSNSTKSILQNDLEKEIDGLVLNFVEGKKIQSYKLEDFIRKPLNEGRESSHIYQITIADILEFVSTYNLDEIQLNEESVSERYLELMSAVFNEYVSKNSSKFIGVDFESADFAQADSFKLNTAFIKNEKTVQHVSNGILAELFKITLGSFKKKRTKASDILTEDMINKLNEMVEKIEKIVLHENSNEASIYDYKNFMLHNKIVTTMNEALTVNHTEQGAEPVNIFVGRFQPFTLGHAKVLEAIHKENGYPVIVFLIKSKTKKPGDEFRKPYSEDLQIKMFKQVQKQYKFLKDIIVLDRAAIDYMFNALRPKYEPVLWGTGTDRIKSYSGQVHNDKYRDVLNVRADFDMFEIPRGDDNISATKVRNAMLDGDEAAFKQMTPRAIHKMYNTLKSQLESSMATVEKVTTTNENIGLMTFEQFMNKLRG